MKQLITKEAQEGSSKTNWLAVAILTMIFMVSAVSQGIAKEPQQAESNAPTKKLMGYRARKDALGKFTFIPVYEHNYIWPMTPDQSQLSDPNAIQKKIRGYQAGIDSRTGAIKTFPIYEEDHDWLKTPDLSQLPTYHVVRVIDGDTIVVNDSGEEVTVRLIGVDTPETVHPTKTVECYGKEASNFLSNLLNGKKVFLRSDPSGTKTDRYGRALAYVYLAPDGLLVNAEIIRRGYGHAYTQFPFKYINEFKQLEQTARNTKKGLWLKVAKDAEKRLLLEKAKDTERRLLLKRSYAPEPTYKITTPTQGFPEAENGSYYGQISTATGRPKTVHVSGYYRGNGTYVRGHYRSKPSR